MQQCVVEVKHQKVRRCDTEGEERAPTPLRDANIVNLRRPVHDVAPMCFEVQAASLPAAAGATYQLQVLHHSLQMLRVTFAAAPASVGPWCRRNFIPRRSNLVKNQTGLPGPNPKPTPAWFGGWVRWRHATTPKHAFCTFFHVQPNISYKNKGRALVRSRVQGWARSARGIGAPGGIWASRAVTPKIAVSSSVPPAVSHFAVSPPSSAVRFASRRRARVQCRSGRPRAARVQCRARRPRTSHKEGKQKAAKEGQRKKKGRQRRGSCSGSSGALCCAALGGPRGRPAWREDT